MSRLTRSMLSGAVPEFPDDDRQGLGKWEQNYLTGNASTYRT